MHAFGASIEAELRTLGWALLSSFHEFYVLLLLLLLHPWPPLLTTGKQQHWEATPHQTHDLLFFHDSRFFLSRIFLRLAIEPSLDI